MRHEQMLSAMILLLAISIGAVSGFTCPPRPEGGCYPGLYPNPLNCGQFYQCDLCIPYLKDCPQGLHFSTITNTCLRPWEANCRVSTIVPSSTTQFTTASSTSTKTTVTTPNTTPNTKTTPVSTPTTPISSATTAKTTPASTQTTPVSSGTTAQTTPTTPVSSGTTAQTTPSPIPRGADAFFVARDAPLNGNQAPLPFSKVIVNTCGNYNSSSHIFTAPSTGVYFFSMSAGALGGSGLIYSLAARRPADIYRTAVEHNGPDTLSRDIIQALQEGDEAFIVTSGGQGVYSDDELQTSWSGFRLSDTMEKLVAFSVGRLNPLEEQGRVWFNDVVTNVGGGWDTSEHVFRAPQSGIYFLTYSVGAYGGMGRTRVQLRHNSGRLIELFRSQETYSGIDTLSRATMVYLEAAETVEMYNVANAIFSDPELTTSFSGFLYQTEYMVAWSVHRSTSWKSPDTPLFPVEFDQVFVNHGGGYNQTAHYFRAPVAGVYYVHINCGAEPRWKINFNVVYNGQRSVFDIFRDSDAHDDRDTLGRGAVVPMEQGDTLAVGAGSGSGFYSDTELQTSFTGFLIHRT